MIENDRDIIIMIINAIVVQLGTCLHNVSNMEQIYFFLNILHLLTSKPDACLIWIQSWDK